MAVTVKYIDKASGLGGGMIYRKDQAKEFMKNMDDVKPTKNITARRDELALTAIKSEFSGEMIPKYHVADFKAGFDACLNELKPEIDALVKALGQVSGCFNCGGCRETAIETITKFKAFMENNND